MTASECLAIEDCKCCIRCETWLFAVVALLSHPRTVKKVTQGESEFGARRSRWATQRLLTTRDMHALYGPLSP